MTQDVKKDTTLHTIAKRMMLLLLMMTLEVGIVWGQTDHSGFWYIQNQKNQSHYLYPSGDKDGSDNPYAKTLNKQDLSAVWMLIKNGDYYNIRHYSDGKYLIANDSTVLEKTVALITVEDLATYGYKALFVITETSDGSGIYTIMPKGANNADSKNYLNPIGGVGKNIGLFTASDQASQWKMIAMPAKPTLSQTDNKVTITTVFGDAYYKLDNKDISTDDATAPSVVGDGIDGTKGKTVTLEYGPKYTVRAIAAYKNETYEPKEWWTSDVTTSSDYQIKLIAPNLSVTGNTVSISSTQGGTNYKFKYSYEDGVDLKTGGTTYSSPISLEAGSRYVVRAIAYNEVGGKTYYSDQEASVVVNLRGTVTLNSLADIDDPTGNYVLSDNFVATGTPQGNIGSSGNPFKGTIDGGMKTISASGPLFECIENATIKNIVLTGVNVSITNGNAGAIACEAKGASRIYNCGVLDGTVSGSGYTGGLVGLLDGSSRVINCFSYANITGGSNVGGIVGYNNYASTASDIRTMVMNCMFYGDITGGTKRSPVYGGLNINNLNSGGLNTFNYYAYEKATSFKAFAEGSNKIYNSALAIEEKYLNRFEFYRLLLNSNKKLASFYVTGSADNGGQMLKWVLETADRSITAPKSYPILKAQGYYPSIINPDFDNAPDSATVGRNHGGKLPSPRQTLSVTISAPKGWTNAPSGAKLLDENGAEIENNETTRVIPLLRTDKDFDRFNFNYDKVQLPYYNDYGTKNYTSNKVVTGWKIIDITTVSGDPYSVANYPTSGITDYPNHNYADRKSSNKDKYSVSGRVFSQGAYFDVPYGVESITIEPYWGNAIYVADPNYDVVYKNDYSGKQNVTQTGTQAVDNTTEFNGQKIRTSITGLGSGAKVYDNAVVLVGNFHLDGVPSSDTTPFTIMSVDEDNDHEPDYSLIYHHKGRLNMSPIRFDFLDVIGTAQAQKPNGASLVCNMTLCKTRGWFEITNTSLLSFSQFEYENLGNSDNSNNSGKVDAPLILLGGVIDQFVSTQNSDVNGKVIYIHVGGNVYINSFGLGTHSDGSKSTPHVPVSVTGGEFPGFYLTGTYNANAEVRTDNAECYISGGYFHEAAGASQEAIDGNVRWQIYNADIDNFYGGGTNDAKPITGKVTVDIYNSYVTTYCGGPKFGNMQNGNKVVTNANGCVFGTYFGAGFGGLSYSRKKYFDASSYDFKTLQKYYYNPESTTKHENERGKYYNGTTTDCPTATYGKKGPGVATDFDYEFFVWSSGKTGARFFVKFASFSLAQCNDVESKLKNCIIENNYYGGGSLGKVVGTVTSELDDCTVKGNVFGAGFSASLPTLEVRDAGFAIDPNDATKYLIPNFNASSGMFEPGTFSGTTTFQWENGSFPDNGKADPKFSSGKVTTNINLDKSNLGSVNGDVNLTIKGKSKIGTDGDTSGTKGNVFGGGESSYVTGATHKVTVNLQGETQVLGNVYGGGDEGLVEGSAEVNITQ